MQDIPYDVSHVPIDYDNSVGINEASDKDERRDQRELRAALERDVAQLQKKLLIEINMRNALSRGLSRPLGALPRIYASLPLEIRELLLEVAVLEEEIISLEKQVIYLGREVEIQAMPAMDDETICYEKDPDQTVTLDKAEILVSPAVSPKDCSRLNPKPSLSPSKSFNQKSSLSKPSFSVGKSAEIKSSAVKTSIPSRNSSDNSSSIKSLTSTKDSIEPKRIVTVAPQKPQIHKSASIPKVSLKTSRDFKSRRLSFTKIEPHETTAPATHSVGPFIPLQLSLIENEENALAASPAPVSPSDVGKTVTKPPRIKTDNLKPPVIGSARAKLKNPQNSNVAPVTRPLKPASTPRLSGQERGPLNSSRILRHPVTLASSLNRKKSSTATLGQSVHAHETSSAPVNGESILRSGHQKPADAKDSMYNINNEEIPSHDEVYGDYEPIVLSPNHAKVNQQNCSPERVSKSLDPIPDSVFLSEEVVKFLASIYGNLQEKQATSTSDTGSSQASTSTTLSSASPDDYNMNRGTNINFKLDACHVESFRSKRSTSIRYVQGCHSGEVAEPPDPHTCLNMENISTRAIFHQRLM